MFQERDVTHPDLEVGMPDSMYILLAIVALARDFTHNAACICLEIASAVGRCPDQAFTYCDIKLESGGSVMTWDG